MMVKDKNRPKAPMSPYACFVQVIREEHRKKHPTENVIFSEFSKKCAEKWKLMTSDQRRCFEEMAKLDTERFNREMAHYVPPAGMRRGRRRRRIRDPAMPKRSWSAFFFFCDAFRSKIRSEHPDWKVSDIAKELGRRWEECTDKEKYERFAQNDKLRYEQDMLNYKAGIYVAIKRARVDETGNSAVSSSERNSIDAGHGGGGVGEGGVAGGEGSQISRDGELEEEDEEEEPEEDDDEEIGSTAEDISTEDKRESVQPEEVEHEN